MHSIVLCNPTLLVAPFEITRRNQGQEYLYLGLSLQLNENQTYIRGSDVRRLLVKFTPSKTVFKEKELCVRFPLSIEVSSFLIRDRQGSFRRFRLKSTYVDFVLFQISE